MGRRSNRKLRAVYASRSSRSVSLADGPGYLYAFLDGRQWKIGMARNFARRKAEWNRQCPYPKRRWMHPIWVARRRRAESLAHILLELVCIDRPREFCHHCWKTHFEKFVFHANRSFAWKKIIRPRLLRAARA
ncbi:hypothetical protein EV361DRAFT_957258 [Lentinula raphanica]|nr:hypothetical protein EV361DRAFT_957258 [Lentinula raphanica]